MMRHNIGHSNVQIRAWKNYLLETIWLYSSCNAISELTLMRLLLLSTFQIRPNYTSKTMCTWRLTAVTSTYI